LGFFLLTLSIPPEARSELITFAFTGTVTSVFVDPDYQSFDFPDVGDPFTGFYSFDSNAPDSDGSPERGVFTTVLSDRAVRVSIGPLRLEARSSGVVTYQDSYYAGNWITSHIDGMPNIAVTSDPALGQLLGNNLFFLVVGRDNLISDPNVLPLTPPSLVGADEAGLILWLDDNDDFRPFPEVAIEAALETLRLVPEPSNTALMLITLIWILQSRSACACLGQRQ